MLGLVNEPAWIRYIGDKNVRTLEDAQRYIENGPMAMYARYGFGLYMVEAKASAQPIGICGLIKRDTLEDVDLGFAFLPRFWGKGYAFESAAAVMSYGWNALALPRIVAIVAHGNAASERLLDKLGFRFESLVKLPSSEEELKLYAVTT